MRIHLGHHFYGAGNLGDDFMLAGFLQAMRILAPHTRLSACVPFSLETLRTRFPEIEWKSYEPTCRALSIANCDAWLGLGGSPFQSAQSRWFVEHLAADAAICELYGKPMYFLGIGVQSESETRDAEVQSVCAQAAAIWTRDDLSASHLAKVAGNVRCAADLAHVFLRDCPPPSGVPGRTTIVANFDFGGWPGMLPLIGAIGDRSPAERVWLVQESRELPGAERALFAQLPEQLRSSWQLSAPELPGESLASVLSRWPSGEILVTSRYHAAIAGAWAGSRIVVVPTNEKLRAVARELGTVTLAPDADQAMAALAIRNAAVAPKPTEAANAAFEACREFVSLVRY